MKTTFAARGKVEISRFKGLGEMPAAQLRQTTMERDKRTLLRVQVPDRYADSDRPKARETAQLVESLMGRKPELRFAFIQEHAKLAQNLDV